MGSLSTESPAYRHPMSRDSPAMTSPYSEHARLNDSAKSDARFRRTKSAGSPAISGRQHHVTSDASTKPVKLMSSPVRHHRVAAAPSSDNSSFAASSWNSDKRHDVSNSQTSSRSLSRSSRSPTRTGLMQSGAVVEGSHKKAATAQHQPPRSSRPRSRRVLFKNNVAVYRFDSDSGADSSSSSIYSSLSDSGYGNRVNYDSTSRSASDLSGRPRVMPVWHGPKVDSAGSGLRHRGVGGGPSQSSLSSSEPATNKQLQQQQRQQQHGHEACVTLWHLDDYQQQQQLRPDMKSPSIVSVRYSLQMTDRGFEPDHRRHQLQSQQQHLVLTCQLQPMRRWDSDDIVVKANRSGSRIRIVFGLDSAAIDQLLLPVVVDPYRLIARLEQDCRLVIEAPIICRY